jgi:putative transcriptional regulator
MMKEQIGKTAALFLIVAAGAMVLFTPFQLLHGADAFDGYLTFSYGAIPEHRFQSGGKPSKGKFLVASRSIGDPRFSETVILLLKHDQSGSMGLIINRPTEVRLSSLFPEITGLQKRTDTIFVGGPVGRNEIFMLIRSRGIPEGSLYVMKETYVSTSMTVLKGIANDSKAKEKFRLYDGYAGWGSGQLEQEVMRGDWRVLEADAETVFERDSEKIWPELILRSSAIQTRRDSGIHLF